MKKHVALIYTILPLTAFTTAGLSRTSESPGRGTNGSVNTQTIYINELYAGGFTAKSEGVTSSDGGEMGRSGLSNFEYSLCSSSLIFSG